MTGYHPRLMLSASLPETACGVPAPGALWFVSVVALIRVTSLKDLHLLEDGFDEGRPVTGYPPRLMLSASLPEIACGGTHSRSALVHVGCRSGEDGFVGKCVPNGRRLFQILSTRKPRGQGSGGIYRRIPPLAVVRR